MGPDQENDVDIGKKHDHIASHGLFSEFKLNSLILRNRFVLPGMQRGWCDGGAPTDKLTSYYLRRLEGGVGLIISESVAVDHDSATQIELFSRLNDKTVEAWARCIGKLRSAGGSILLQLWHEGAVRKEGGDGPYAAFPTLSPSGLMMRDKHNGRAATQADLLSIRDAFVRSAKLAQQAGAHGIEVHGAHGYLLDQFLWAVTNRRDDGYGGDDIRNRVRFPADIVAAIRQACGPEFVISFRFSQWKEADFEAKIVHSPEELGLMLLALREAGVDVLHASTRRFWKPEWPESELALAGWTKRLSGLPVITVGSVGLSTDIMESMFGAEAENQIDRSVAALEQGLAGGHFDLIAVGRGQIGDAEWVNKVRERRFGDIRLFRRSDIGAFDVDMDHMQTPTVAKAR